VSGLKNFGWPIALLIALGIRRAEASAKAHPLKKRLPDFRCSIKNAVSPALTPFDP
jgi:hypothetical protein